MAGILLGGSQRPGAAAPVRTTTGAAPGSSSSAPPAPVAGYVRRPAGRILVQDAVEAVGTGRVGEGRLAHAGAAPRSARGVAAAAAGSSFRRQGPARSSGAGTGRAEPLGVRRPLGRHATGALSLHTVHTPPWSRARGHVAAYLVLPCANVNAKREAQ